MKKLNRSEIISISGGDVCNKDMCLKVSSAGIPPQHFAVIENAFQQQLNGNLDDWQLRAMIIRNPDSFAYAHTYVNNANRALLEKIFT